ncbi:MAG: hypothetical protein ACE5FD_02945 [Anaerolineae bacterium]
MDKIAVTNCQTNPQTQDAIEEALQEALLAAEFFGLVPRDPNVSLLTADSPLVDYLESAERYVDVPFGLDDLVVLAKFGGRRQ